MKTLVAALAALLQIGLASDASAFVLVKIREVYAGPDGQYVMLQLADDLQGDVANKSITVFGPTGALVGTFTFPTDVSNDLSQATILVGTPEVANPPLGVTPDLAMTGVIQASGGKVCFDVVDCVAWGNYSGGTGGICNSDQPPNCSPAAPGGIPSSKALRRSTAGGNPALLELGDDTNVSADDFDVVDPAPINNGTIPTTSTTTSTTTIGTGATTTTPGESTTSTTLGCAPAGIDGARCVLNGLPPAACAKDDVPRRIPHFASAARNLLDRAAAAPRETRMLRLVKRAAAKLAKASNASVRAADKTKISPDCAAALRAIFDGARGRLTAILPAS